MKSCRICLLMGVRLCKIGDPAMKDFLENLFFQAGFRMKLDVSHTICFECKGLLSKCYHFIQKALRGQREIYKILQKTKKISLEELQSLDRSKLGLNSNLGIQQVKIDFFIKETDCSEKVQSVTNFIAGKFKKSEFKENLGVKFSQENESKINLEADFSEENESKINLETEFSEENESKLNLETEFSEENESKINLEAEFSEEHESKINIKSDESHEVESKSSASDEIEAINVTRINEEDEDESKDDDDDESELIRCSKGIDPLSLKPLQKNPKREVVRKRRLPTEYYVIKNSSSESSDEDDYKKRPAINTKNIITGPRKKKLKFTKYNNLDSKRKNSEQDEKNLDVDYEPTQSSTVSESSSESYDDEGKKISKPKDKRKYPMQCENCDYEIEKKTTHYHHYLFHHPTIEYPYSRPYTHVCQFCGKKYSTASRVRTHELSHGKTKNVKCLKCNTRFWNRPQMLRHISDVHPNTLLYCDYCNKAFKTRPSIVLHIRTHTGEKPFKCHICGAGFAHRGNVGVHIRANHEKDKLNRRKKHFKGKSKVKKTKHEDDENKFKDKKKKNKAKKKNNVTKKTRKRRSQVSDSDSNSD